MSSSDPFLHLMRLFALLSLTSSLISLLYFYQDFKPHAEMLFSSFEQLVPHLPVSQPASQISH